MATAFSNDRGADALRGNAVLRTNGQPVRHPEQPTEPMVTGGQFAPVPSDAGTWAIDFVDRSLRAELDQARLFDDMLRAEIARLEHAVRYIEIRAGRRIDDSAPPLEVRKRRGRIADIHRQRAALWRRFLGSSQSA
jgi:hypothetical protein